MRASWTASEANAVADGSGLDDLSDKSIVPPVNQAEEK